MHPSDLPASATDTTWAALRESEALYRMIADNSDDIITLSTPDGRVVYISPSGERLTGFSAEEVLGHSGYELIHPDDMSALADLQSQDTPNIMLRTRRKAGDYLWVEVSIKHLLDPDTGAVRHILSIARDISDRVEAGEELIRMRQLLDEAQHLAGVGSWEIDLVTARVTWSAGMYALYGLDPHEERDLHATFWHSIHPEDVARVREMTDAARAACRDYEMDYRIVLPGGVTKHVHSRAYYVAEAGRAVRLVGTTQDVTERKRADEALRASEARYRLIAENTDDMIAITDLTGRTHYVSPASRRLLGLEPEALINETAFSLVHPDDLPRVHVAFASLNQGAEVPEIAVRLARADGTYVWVEASTRLVQDESTGETRIISVTRDISGRKQAEVELERSQAILKAQQEASIEGLLLIDEHGEVVSYNRRYLDLWKVPESLMASADDEALLNYVGGLLADPAGFRARVEYLYQHPMESGRDEIEFKDGRVLDRYTTPALSPQGDYYGRLWYFRDVTDRKQAEQELRLITEGTASVTGEEFFKALVQHLAEVLRSRCAFVGRLLGGGATIRTVAMWDEGELAPNIDYPMAGTPCLHTIHDGEFFMPAGLPAAFPEDHFLIDAGFESYWGVRLMDAAGRVLGHIGVIHDDTLPRDERSTRIMRIFAARAAAEMERQRAEGELARSADELKEANAHLKELDRHKVNYINSVSHELRTPLTSIIGYTEFLEDTLREKGDEESLEFVAQVRHSTTRIQRLVDDLLDFALIEAGTFKLNLEPTNFCAKVGEVVESLRPQVEKARVTLDTDLAECPMHIEADPQRVTQVVLNLLTNAIKFTPRGGAVHLRAFVRDGQLMCEVRDSGPGIAPEDQPKLFKRYTQLGPRRGGTGLGLSISKALIDAHGGQIGVRSVMGEGSTFWFSLPLSRPAAAPPR